MKYFFVLGTNTTLSVAEIFAVLHFKKANLLAKDFLIIDSEQEIVVDNLIKKLGGVIKIGRIISEINTAKQQLLEKEISKLARHKQANAQGGKFKFGLSDYGPQVFDKKDLGLKLKRYFKDQKISARLVVSREKNLSSVVVTQNKLLKKGLEIVLAVQGSTTFIGETLTVQAFKDLSRRDYGRPARDDLSGMIPPKLAQIMINLAQINDQDASIIDPFCGSGTILSEAILAGYKSLFGSDISFQAIQNTRKNTEWLKELYEITDCKLKLLVKNAIYLSKFIKKESISAIITEPYLGPQRGRIDFSTVTSNLEKLYSQALAEFLKVLKNKGRVVMIWPMFYGQRPITPNYQGFKILDMIPESLKTSKFIKKNQRPSIIYGRPGQKIFREVVVLEKI